MSSNCCTIIVTPIEANNLKNVQKIGKQDPYCNVILKPWDDSVKCKPVSGGGTDVEWDIHKHKSELVLHYPGRPKKPNKPELIIEVKDAEMTQKDRIIGIATLELSKLLSKRKKERMTLKLYEKPNNKGSSCGELVIDFEIELYGTLEITCKSATGNL